MTDSIEKIISEMEATAKATSAERMAPIYVEWATRLRALIATDGCDHVAGGLLADVERLRQWRFDVCERLGMSCAAGHEWSAADVHAHFCNAHSAMSQRMDIAEARASALANPASPTSGCTEPNRAECPRMCMDFCNAAEQAQADVRSIALESILREHAEGLTAAATALTAALGKTAPPTSGPKFDATPAAHAARIERALSVACADPVLCDGRLKALQRGLVLARKWSNGTAVHGDFSDFVKRMAEELREALSSQAGDYQPSAAAQECHDCFGHGILLDADVTCPRCNGSGKAPPDKGPAAQDGCGLVGLIDAARREYRDSDAAGDVLDWLEEHALTQPAGDLEDAARYRLMLDAIFGGDQADLLNALIQTKTPDEYTGAIDAARRARGEG